jgi:peptidoglycan/xylan/chitin deacetylase (PgdA/CDA1 family)
MSVERRGGFVISLDFELFWGVRDHRKLDESERKRLLAARSVVPKILAAFQDHEIRATWATVGFLFARSREEALACRPDHVPGYRQARLDPYVEPMGRDESEDPFRFAPSLVREIEQAAGQEIGSHSYSHYYSLEEGQSEKEFRADLASAIRIAENSGYQLRSYVFPRNQVRRLYLPILQQAGFHAYRGTEPAASKAPVTYHEQRRPWLRALRLADAYWDLNGPQTVAFPKAGRLARVAASRYLRPFSPALSSLESLRLNRIATAMKSAATEGRIFHLWWHPEDFASHPDRNIEFLRKVLNVFDKFRRIDGMESLSMGDVGRMSDDSMTARFSGATK